MRTIIIKELRENIRWLPVGILLISIVVWPAVPIRLNDVGSGPAGPLAAQIGVGASLFAILLAFLQSVWDLSERQRGFLFHRAATANQILYAKVIAGSIIYTAACSVPLLFVAAWFAYMGLDYLPVRPLQVLPSLLTCLLCFVLHPATLISVDREAKWFGTKAIPLIGACLWVLFYSNTLLLTRDAILLTDSMLALLFLVLPGFLVIALFSVQRLTWARSVLLFIATTSVFCLAVVWFNDQLSKWMRNETIQGIAVDADGVPWYTTSDQNGNLLSKVRMGATEDDDPTAQDLAPISPINWGSLLTIPSNPVLNPKSNELIDYVARTGRRQIHYDSRGYLLVYESDLKERSRLVGIFSKDGFRKPGEVLGKRFTLNAVRARGSVFSRLSLAGYDISSLLVDEVGVYQIDQKTSELKTLLDMPIEAAATVPNADNTEVRLIVNSTDKSHLFSISVTEGNVDWYEPIDQNAAVVSGKPVPNLELKQVGSFAKLPVNQNDYWFVGETSSGDWLLTNPMFHSFGLLKQDSDAAWQIRSLNINHYFDHDYGVLRHFALIPIGLIATCAPASQVYDDLKHERPAFESFFKLLPSRQALISGLLIGMLAAVTVAILTIVVCRRRVVSRQATLLWIIASLFIGLAAPLSILAIYSIVYRERCENCSRKRRVDKRVCEHCGAVRRQATAKGIEIFERSTAPKGLMLEPIES